MQIQKVALSYNNINESYIRNVNLF